VGDLAAVMREAVLWTSRGRNVTEDDLTAMLEGREDLSEVQENPFAEMMKEDEAAENAQVPAENAQVPAEKAPVESVSPAEGSAPVIESAPETSAPVEDIPVEEPVDAPVESVDETPVEEPQPTDVPATEPTAAQTMSDEEFEAFMKKAQAFYDTQANESSEETDDSSSSDDSDDDDFPSIEVHSGD